MEGKIERDAACLAQAMPSPVPSGEDIFGGLTVGQVIGQGKESCKLRPSDVLGDLAEALASSGRTAMAVIDEADNSKAVALLTANDIMRAYFEGTSPDTRLSEWLASGSARAPPTLMQRLIVHPSTLLTEVAEKMVANAVAGDCACHHILVQKESGGLDGVISSHDLVRALCRHETWKHHPSFPDMFAPPDAEEAFASRTVRSVMKDMERVFTCQPGETLRDALKVLLVTQQNSVLVMDNEGIYGVITPRDIVKAFVDVVGSDVSLATWLSERSVGIENRMIASDAQIADAADLMTSQDIDHLVVIRPGGKEAAGVVSSLDVMVHTRARTPLLRYMPLWEGPTVGDVLQQHSYLTEVCRRGITLSEVAEKLAGSGRTSVVVELGTDGIGLGLLTENDIMRAYIDGWARHYSVAGYLMATESQRAAVHLQVPPSMPLTEAAALMMEAAEPGRTCHHLVVKSVCGGWLGVFSTLDIARAIHGLSSELEVARTGTDQMTVGRAMKPSVCVPRCKPTDSIRHALGTLDMFGQNAALVVDEKEEVHGLITPRCAMQALAEGVPADRSVSAWLQSRQQADGPREVLVNTPLMEAAGTMTAHSLHHLLAVENIGGKPLGVLSSLDLARGVASINYHCPFVTLRWLWLFGGPTSSCLQAPRSALGPKHKRPRSPLVGEAAEREAGDVEVMPPAQSRPRTEE
mmetsp:Transcript_124243/g.310593  ORF Transcript_124243/g.310593 Transcript_124243/m.310593 type:complete len:693 (-) Transcript_124243:99-2177(-)